MAYAKRPEKNLKGCRTIARESGNKLTVIGLKNKWFRRLQPDIEAKGFLGGEERNRVIQGSKALLFPVLSCPILGVLSGACLLLFAILLL